MKSPLPCPQMAAYAAGKPPPPTLHWQHRRSESVKLIALMAALLLVGGLVVASVRGFAQGIKQAWELMARCSVLLLVVVSATPRCAGTDGGHAG